jgi:hypothetical protein
MKASTHRMPQANIKKWERELIISAHTMTLLLLFLG